MDHAIKSKKNRFGEYAAKKPKHWDGGNKTIERPEASFVRNYLSDRGFNRFSHEDAPNTYDMLE